MGDKFKRGGAFSASPICEQPRKDPFWIALKLYSLFKFRLIYQFADLFTDFVSFTHFHQEVFHFQIHHCNVTVAFGCSCNNNNFTQGKLSPNSKTNCNWNPNPNSNWGELFFGGNCPDTNQNTYLELFLQKMPW